MGIITCGHAGHKLVRVVVVVGVVVVRTIRENLINFLKINPLGGATLALGTLDNISGSLKPLQLFGGARIRRIAPP